MTSKYPHHRFGSDLVFYAARGFAQSLTASQREAMLSLFASDDKASILSAVLEQTEFELGHSSEGDPDAMILSALEYALPRMTSAGHSVATGIERSWNAISDETKSKIRIRVLEAIKSGRAGADCDVACWKRLASLPINEIERATRTSSI